MTAILFGHWCEPLALSLRKIFTEVTKFLCNIDTKFLESPQRLWGPCSSTYRVQRAPFSPSKLCILTFVRGRGASRSFESEAREIGVEQSLLVRGPRVAPRRAVWSSCLELLIWHGNTGLSSIPHSRDSTRSVNFQRPSERIRVLPYKKKKK